MNLSAFPTPPPFPLLETTPWAWLCRWSWRCRTKGNVIAKNYSNYLMIIVVKIIKFGPLKVCVALRWAILVTKTWWSLVPASTVMRRHCWGGTETRTVWGGGRGILWGKISKFIPFHWFQALWVNYPLVDSEVRGRTRTLFSGGQQRPSLSVGSKQKGWIGFCCIYNWNKDRILIFFL